MRVQLLAKRYAQALFGLAVENNLLEEVHNDMQLVDAVLEENRTLRKMLTNPVIAGYKKVKVFNKLFEGKLQKLSLKFLALIVSKGRERYIVPICRSFDDIYKDYKNIVSVELITAVETDDELRNEIVKKLKTFTEKHLELTEVIDDDIIGGFKLSFEDYQYDASIRTLLKRMEKEFSKNLYVKKY